MMRGISVARALPLLLVMPSVLHAQGDGIDLGAELARRLDAASGDVDFDVEELWRALEWEAWSAELERALAARLERAPGLAERQALDTLLDLRNLPHECPDVERFLGRPGVAPQDLLPLPAEPLALEERELVARLESCDPVERDGAAVALLLREPTDLRALRSVLRRPGFFERRRSGADPWPVWAWMRNYAGEAAGAAVAAELEESREDAHRLALLVELGSMQRSAQRAALAPIAALATRDDESGAAARRRLAALADLRGGRREDWGCHTTYATAPLEDSELESALSVALSALLAARAARVLDPVDVDLLHGAGLRSAAVREAITPALVERLTARAPDWFDALRMLGHFGVTTEPVRSAYLDVVGRWEQVDPDSLARLPCWREHDAETSAVLERVLERAWDPAALIDRLVFAGRVDAERDPWIAQILNESPSWFLHSSELRLVSWPEPEEARVDQVHRLALSIATLRARGGDSTPFEEALADLLLLPFEEDGAGGSGDWRRWGLHHAQALDLRGSRFVEAALSVLCRELPLWNHEDVALLRGAKLTRVQTEALAALPPKGPYGWAAFELLGASGLPPSARRHLPRIRAGLFDGDLRWLEYLMALGPLAPREEPYLCALLERGSADQRKAARAWAARQF